MRNSLITNRPCLEFAPSSPSRLVSGARAERAPIERCRTKETSDEGTARGEEGNPTNRPKLFSEIRRFFRASSEMIFARINPYGRHGNRLA